MKNELFHIINNAGKYSNPVIAEIKRHKQEIEEKQRINGMNINDMNKQEFAIAVDIRQAQTIPVMKKYFPIDDIGTRSNIRGIVGANPVKYPHGITDYVFDQYKKGN